MLEDRFARALTPNVFADERNIGPLSISTVADQHTRLRRNLKLPEKCVVHSLRHTFGTRLGASGVDAFVIKRVMGHSSVAVSEQYIHPTPESLERAFERLENYNGETAKNHLQATKLFLPATPVREESGVTE